MTQFPEPPPMQFFGRRWNAPAFTDAVRVPTPLGAVCPSCQELVDENDSGIMQATIRACRDLVLEPIHIECHLRMLFGCVAHLEHQCSCYGGSEHDGHDRRAARAVLDWIIAEQAARGIPDPGFVNE